MEYENNIICPLCNRTIPESQKSKHHLIPLSKKGKNGPTVNIHKICHGKIHSVFTEKELVKKYNTIETIKENEEIKKFIIWIKTKPDYFYDSNKRKK